MSKTYYHESGKGYDRRPREVSKETYESNWDRIFGKKEEKQEICKACNGTRGAYDCGWWYSCSVCSADVATGADGQPVK